MNLSRLVLIAFACAFCATACNKPEQAAPGTTPPKLNAIPSASVTPDAFANTRGIYGKLCSSCHGETGEGKTVEVEGKKIKAPSLRTGHALTHSDDDFVKQITKGGDGMPAYADKISADGIQDMVRFIRKEFQAGNSPAPK
jgi:mono/diheme cytochrome c family protein